MVIYQNERNRNGAQFLVLSERVMSVPSAIFTPKNFYLITALNDKINEFKSAGLIDHWHDLVIDQKFLKLVSGNNGPHALKLRHVVGCFQLLGVGFFVSLLIFFAEFFYHRYKVNKSLLVRMMSRKQLS